MHMLAARKDDRRSAHRTTTVNRSDLLKAMSYLRNLFRLHELDVTDYSDEAIAEAILQVCPVVTGPWPTDRQLKAVCRRLAHQ